MMSKICFMWFFISITFWPRGALARDGIAPVFRGNSLPERLAFFRKLLHETSVFHAGIPVKKNRRQAPAVTSNCVA